MSWTEHKKNYQLLATGINKYVKLTTKDSWFWKAIAWILFILSFGKFKRESFLTQFATTLGPIQAYPKEWVAIAKRTIVHESRHTEQAQWFGFWIHPWVGLPLMGVFYLLLPFPIFFAWVRYRLELDADQASWKFLLNEESATNEIVLDRAERFAKTVSSGSYLWAWPRSWAIKGFRKKALKVIRQNNKE